MMQLKQNFMNLKLLKATSAAFFALFFGLQVVGATMVGHSAFPLKAEAKYLGVETVNVLSKDGGMGLQARLSGKVTSLITVDGGIGMNGGERNSANVFVGADYELFPDYKDQPRVSIKGTYMNAKDYDVRWNKFTVTPTVSKGFDFWGQQAYPFVGVPVTLGLHSGTNTYVTMLNATLGFATHLPIEGYRELLANVEMSADLKDSYSYFLLGLSFPIR